MKGFRSGEFQIMVATDIAARGIDVSSISHVINYDIPDTTEAYTHRIGRTGRAARSGDALTLVCNEDRSMVHAIERVLKAPLEKRRLDDFDYNVRQNETSRAEFSRPPRPSSPPRRSREAEQRGGSSPASERFRRQKSSKRPSAGYRERRVRSSDRGFRQGATAF